MQQTIKNLVNVTPASSPMPCPWKGHVWCYHLVLIFQLPPQNPHFAVQLQVGDSVLAPSSTPVTQQWQDRKSWWMHLVSAISVPKLWLIFCSRLGEKAGPVPSAACEASEGSHLQSLWACTSQHDKGVTHGFLKSWLKAQITLGFVVFYFLSW